MIGRHDIAPLEDADQYLALNAQASNITVLEVELALHYQTSFRCLQISAPLANRTPPPPFLVDELRPRASSSANHWWRFYDSLFCFVGFRNRTPAPPPFSSMNSTPAALSFFSMISSVFGSPTYRPTSMLLIVFR